MGLKARHRANALNRGLADSQLARHFTAGPVSAAGLGALLDFLQHSTLHRWCGRSYLAPLVPPVQPCQAILLKSLFPLRDRGGTGAQLDVDRLI